MYQAEHSKAHRRYGTQWWHLRGTWPACVRSEWGGRKEDSDPRNWTPTLRNGADIGGRPRVCAAAERTSALHGWSSHVVALSTTRTGTDTTLRNERILSAISLSTAHHQKHSSNGQHFPGTLKFTDIPPTPTDSLQHSYPCYVTHFNHILYCQCYNYTIRVTQKCSKWPNV